MADDYSEAASCVGEDGRDNGPAWHVTPPGDSAVGTVSGVSMVSIVSILSTLAQSQFPGAGIKEAANLRPARAICTVLRSTALEMTDPVLIVLLLLGRQFKKWQQQSPASVHLSVANQW